jgi:hypothetical protein
VKSVEEIERHWICLHFANFKQGLTVLKDFALTVASPRKLYCCELKVGPRKISNNAHSSVARTSGGRCSHGAIRQLGSAASHVLEDDSKLPGFASPSPPRHLRKTIPTNTTSNPLRPPRPRVVFDHIYPCSVFASLLHRVFFVCRLSGASPSDVGRVG